MTITILDTISKVSAAGKPYCQAACKGISKAGAPFLFIATIPDDLVVRSLTVLFAFQKMALPL